MYAVLSPLPSSWVSFPAFVCCIISIRPSRHLLPGVGFLFLGPLFGLSLSLICSVPLPGCRFLPSSDNYSIRHFKALWHTEISPLSRDVVGVCGGLLPRAHRPLGLHCLPATAVLQRVGCVVDVIVVPVRLHVLLDPRAREVPAREFRPLLQQPSVVAHVRFLSGRGLGAHSLGLREIGN